MPSPAGQIARVPASELTQVLGPPQSWEPAQGSESESEQELEPAQEPEPEQFAESAPEPPLALLPEPEPPESRELTHTPEQLEPLPASVPASEGQRWTVLYANGMSVTTASEQIADSLAEAERQHGRRVTVRRLDDVKTRPRVVENPSVPGSRRAVGGADSEPEPAAVRYLNEIRTRRHSRLLLYALVAACIVVAAALVDHWGVLPRVGANTSPRSSLTQVGGPPQRPQLLPPLGQPPVMHFSNVVDATPTTTAPSAQPTSPAAEPSGAQNPAARPTGSPTSAGSPQSAPDESSGGGPSTIARGG